MKGIEKLIDKKSSEYADAIQPVQDTEYRKMAWYNAKHDATIGAKWMLKQYQGITPETVKELLNSLNELWWHVKLNSDEAMNGSYSIDSLFGKVESSLQKAKKEQDGNTVA